MSFHYLVGDELTRRHFFDCFARLSKTSTIALSLKKVDSCRRRARQSLLFSEGVVAVRSQAASLSTTQYLLTASPHGAAASSGSFLMAVKRAWWRCLRLFSEVRKIW